MQLAYFGKLPSRGDFVRLNGSTPAVRSMDAWIQNGLRTLGQRAEGGIEGAFDNAGCSGFILRHLESPGPVIGTIRPSRDASGRTYPFFIVLQLNAEGTAVGPSAHITRALAEFFSSSGQAIDSAVAGHIDTSDLDDWARDATVRFESVASISSDGAVRTEAIRFDTLCHQIWGSFEDDAKVATFYNLWSVFGPLREVDLPMPGYGIQIPLAGEELLFPSITFWLTVCNRLMNRSGQEPSLIWNTGPARNGNPPLLYINFSTLPASGLAHILQIDLDLETVFRTDLPRGREAVDMRASLSQTILQLIDDGGLSLREFADSLT